MTFKLYRNDKAKKKWFLDGNSSGVFLKSADDRECLKKRNAKQPLGRVLQVQVSDAETLRKFTILSESKLKLLEHLCQQFKV